VTSVNVVTEDT